MDLDDIDHSTQLNQLVVLANGLEDLDMLQSWFHDAEEEDNMLAAASFVVGRAALNRKARADARQRLYLTRPELLPNPRQATPWQHLFESRNDRAFITTMGIDVDTFNYILVDGGFGQTWNSQPIPRPDVQAHGTPRPGRRSLDPAGALGLILHWLNSTMRETSLQQIFALIPSTVTRYLDAAIDCLLEALENLPETHIGWPEGEAFEDFSRIIQDMHPLLAGAFGIVDGLNLPVQVSADEDIENAHYNGWLHSHFVSNVIAWGPNGAIIYFAINAPGSWHDARIARALYERLQHRTPPGYYLVADTAFPRAANSATGGRIKTPLKKDSRLPQGAERRARLMAINRQLLSLRQAAEWGMRDIRGSFGRLRIPLPVENMHLREKILRIVGHLYQLRVRRVGISHIRNTYMPIWRGEGDDMQYVWDNWERMLFKDLRKMDRVSRFHLVH